MFKNGGDGAGAAGAKSERTREAILQAALALMAERGYDATTMRDVAKRAGVSLGNAYYYFASKEHLVQAFYMRTHEEHLAQAERALSGKRTLASRLRAALASHVETMGPHRTLAGALFRSAADPDSPVNPFGKDSEHVRRRAVALFEKVVAGSSDSLPEDLRTELPRLLWLGHMGVVLFWIHDRSKGSRRTLKLIDGACELFGALVSLASLPFAKPLRAKLIALVDDAWGGAA